MTNELNEYLDFLRKNGFRILKPTNENYNWSYFEKHNQVGYVQFNTYDSFSFSTVHKANKQTGTSFGISKHIDKPTIENALESLVFAPAWAFAHDLPFVEKLKNLEEVKKRESWTQYEILESINN